MANAIDQLGWRIRDIDSWDDGETLSVETPERWSDAAVAAAIESGLAHGAHGHLSIRAGATAIAERLAGWAVAADALESGDEDGDFNILETLEALDSSAGTESAADSVSRAQILQVIEAEVSQLPGRQREAFTLRYWEELDVAETAQVMGCSEGSVKTHCSRAVHALAKALQAKGIAP